MIAGLPLTFAQPLLLLGLLSVPVLWWLLRVMPPRPRRIEFPPTRLLFDIRPKEETPSRTPWWLTLLRLAAAALVQVPGERRGAVGDAAQPGRGDLHPTRRESDAGLRFLPGDRAEPAEGRLLIGGEDRRPAGRARRPAV